MSPLILNELNLSLFLRILLTSLIFQFSTVLKAQIKLDDLENSLHTMFDKMDLSKDTVPEKYMMSFDQYENFWKTLNSDKKYEKEHVLKSYSDLKKSIRNSFSKILDKNKSGFNFHSIDSVTYIKDQIPMLKIFIEGEKSFYFMMIRHGNDAYLISYVFNKDKFAYYSSMRNVLKEYYGELINSEKNYHQTYTTLLKVLPFKSIDGLWGFRSLNTGEIVLLPKYDTIWRYTNDFWMLHCEQGYNLIDTNFNFRFSSDVKNMRYRIVAYKGLYEFSQDGIHFEPVSQTVQIDTSKNVNLEELEIVEWTKSTESNELISENTLKTPQTIMDRYLANKEIFSFEDQLYSEKYVVTNSYIDNKRCHMVIANKIDTIITVNEFRDVSVFGPAVICQSRDKVFTEIIFLDDKIKLALPYLIEYKPSESGIIKLFDPINRRFGIYSIYTRTLIEPKYLYIEPAERGAFYWVVDEQGAYYLNAKGEVM